MKKRIILPLMALLCLSSCGETPTSVPTTKPTEEPTTVEPTSEITSEEPTTMPTTINMDDYEFGTYSNPVSVTTQGGIAYNGQVADPGVIMGDDGYLYAVATGGVELRSKDGCEWEFLTSQIIPMPTWPKKEGYDKSYGFWAPDITKVGDRYVLYYSLSGWDYPIGIGCAVSDSDKLTKDTKFVDVGKLFTGAEIGNLNCIDPHVFVDDDGSVWCSFGSMRGIHLVELSADGLSLKGGLEYANEHKIVIAGKIGNWDGGTYEGSYIIKKDGFYYYFGSYGSCCEGADSTYKVAVGKATSITGPYIANNKFKMTQKDSNKSLVVRSPANSGFAGCGHNSIFKDALGDYWIYYHGFTEEDNYAQRHLFMDKLVWDENGYPSVEGLVPTYMEEHDGPAFLKDK